jgi:PAS domain S-box-containing protein
MATGKKVKRRSPTLQRLRQRLKEAEETLTAIREGHIEALVVGLPGAEQVYTLRSADQPYRLMVEQMREGAITLGMDGTVLYCNQRFAELLALPPERIVGQNVRQFIAGDERVFAAILDNESFRGELHLRPAGCALTPAQLSSIALSIDGVRTVAVVITDLTHERVERGLRESNRLKDEFLATLSHELRTPLNVILGWTRMLLRDHLSAESRQHALELIDRNANAQAQLVNDLVDMSRVATGKLRLHLEPLLLLPVVHAALESVRPAADAKALKIDTTWDVAEDVHVLADATRLQQILWNLLSNAIKFTPRGGRIAVTLDSSGGRVRVAVADSGIGIDAEFLPHVFDRFRQADSGTTRVYGGLGLGLAIVHDLVHLHGGEVEVQSAGAGRGATFTVTLPTTNERGDGRVKRQRRGASADLSGRCVMLVEDHADSRELMVQALEQAGATVAAFENARDAYDAIARVRPAVVVADVGLPGESGYSLIRQIRGHHEAALRLVPAVAVTAYATDVDRAEALAAGFQQHLAKPVDPGHLIETLNAITRRGST